MGVRIAGSLMRKRSDYLTLLAIRLHGRLIRCSLGVAWNATDIPKTRKDWPTDGSICKLAILTITDLANLASKANFGFHELQWVGT